MRAPTAVALLAAALAQQQVRGARLVHFIACTGGERQLADIEPVLRQVEIDPAVVQIGGNGLGDLNHLIPKVRLRVQRVDLGNIFLGKKAVMRMAVQKLQRRRLRAAPQQLHEQIRLAAVKNMHFIVDQFTVAFDVQQVFNHNLQWDLRIVLLTKALPIRYF